MQKPRHPLAEVFGHLPSANTPNAIRCRKKRLCPFNNKVPNCTKDKAKDPLGVCSVNHGDRTAVTCPVRFTENWLIADDAADFFFPEGAHWTSLSEVRLADAEDKSAGNIDLLLAAYDEHGRVYDFGSLEVQAVYISGNVREPFAHYMANPADNADMDWAQQPNYPRPDFLSSSRKRLAPQMMFKGGILHEWRKKMAVALDSAFFETLPELRPVDKAEAEIAWLVYDLVANSGETKLSLTRTRVVYTRFLDALNSITRPKVGDVEKFLRLIQAKVDEKLESAPVTKTLENPFNG